MLRSRPFTRLRLARALCAAAAWAGAAAAEPPAPSLTWQAPAMCPDGAAVAERLETVLGAELAAYSRDWQIQGRVSDSAGAWQLVLELREPESAATAAPLQRVLRARRCEDLVEAAALAIAIALGDAREARAAPGEPAASAVRSAAAPSAAAPLVDTPPEQLQPPPALRRSLDLSLEALLDSASVSGAALGGSFGIGAWFGALGLDLHGTWLPSHARSLGPGQSAEFALLAAGARACVRFRGSATSFAVAPCAGFELGRFSADSAGLRAATSVHDPWLAPSLGVDLRGGLLGPLAARSRLELLLPLRRQTYRVDLVQPVHEIPALTVRWSVGIDADLALR